MTVVDDIAAVTIIGVVYSESIDISALIVAVAGVAVLVALGLGGVAHLAVRAGRGCRVVATVGSGLYASIAGMVAGLLIPAFAPRREAVERAATRFRAFRQSPMAEVGRSAKDAPHGRYPSTSACSSSLHPWTSYVIVPLFALANAGVDLRGGVLSEALSSPVTWVWSSAWWRGSSSASGPPVSEVPRCDWDGYHRGVGPGQALGGAALSGIGFTISLSSSGYPSTAGTGTRRRLASYSP